MIVSMIAAIGNNNELGKNNTLLWDMPRDMQYFRDTTRAHTVIMGRKTFESIGFPLPKRENIVITRDKEYHRPGITIMHSLEEALRYAALEQGKHFEEKQEETEIFIIGGGELYKLGMAKAHKLYITRIDGNFPDADAFFPKIGPEWKEVSREDHAPDAENKFPYSFIIYKK